jgi:signal transduction histidine kinase
MTPRPVAWKYVAGLAPVVLVWGILVAWLTVLLIDRANWPDRSDEAAVREWLDETRNFRKSLPELAREYARLSADGAGTDRLERKADEVGEQVRALAEPTRVYPNQLPLFPEVYRIDVSFADGRVVEWDSTLPRPERSAGGRVRTLEYPPLGPDDRRAVIRCEYRVHAFNRQQQQEDERRRTGWVAVALLVAATLLAGLFVVRFLQRERWLDRQRFEREAELLQTRLDRDEAELKQNELNRQLLQQQLDAAALERRAAEAEREASEARTRLYASIGVMAGSYAHNIKNLLVRPNDLLARCVEVNGLSPEQMGMLGEVRSTLGTVTDRLQQILRTIRRDPTKQEAARVDLAALVRETAATWADMARDKWKVVLSADVPAEPAWVDGDASHLQQVLENLLFNARDATFEMRNHVRDEARAADVDAAGRKQRLIDAAGWKGSVRVAVRRAGDRSVLEVTDNGIGMTADVRQNCLTAHFSTKRDNALYQGYSAGMGLGLSFVAVVLEHHGATLDIDSEPLRGATFRATFPPAANPPPPGLV